MKRNEQTEQQEEIQREHTLKCLREGFTEDELLGYCLLPEYHDSHCIFQESLPRD